MCLTCGCRIPEDDHGSSEHITLQRLKAAAHAADIPIEEAASNLSVTVGDLTVAVRKGQPMETRQAPIAPPRSRWGRVLDALATSGKSLFFRRRHAPRHQPQTRLERFLDAIATSGKSIFYERRGARRKQVEKHA